MGDFLRVLIEIVAYIWPFELIMPWQAGLRYRNGKFVRALGPGLYWRTPYFAKIIDVDVAPKPVSAPLQTITLRDKSSCAFSPTIVIQVEDPRAAIETVDNYGESVIEYTTGHLAEQFQNADPEAVTDSIIKRRNLIERARAAADEECSSFGVRVLTIRFTNFALGFRSYRHLIDRATLAPN